MSAPERLSAFEAALAKVVRDAVKEALAEHVQPAVEPSQPALLDREQLAHALGISSKSVDRLRAKTGFPELKLGDCPRFNLNAVLAWIEKTGTGLKLVKGGS